MTTLLASPHGDELPVARERAGPSSGLTRHALALLTAATVALLLAALAPRPSLAHEAWILTPEHMAALEAEPRPALFAHLTVANAAMLAAAAAAAVGLMLLAAAGAGERLPGLARLRALDRHAPRVVRACVAMTLATAALGLHPRHGTRLLEAPTLGFPDLELRLAGPGRGRPRPPPRG